MGQIAKADPGVSPVIPPQTTVVTWQPLDAFVKLCHAVPGDPEKIRNILREVGRVATASTFSRFFGADPGALSSWEVLKTVESLWSQYHSWGSVRVTQQTDFTCLVTISGGPADPLLCASTTGFLEQVAAFANARHARVTHPTCGSGGCIFQLKWQARTLA
jgi:hypothetical protein